MLRFSDSAVAAAGPRAVWKILHDPARFSEWWAGFATVEDVEPGDDAETRFTIYVDTAVYDDVDPRRPMVHALRCSAEGERVVVSCLVADIEFDWRLAPIEGGRATRIDVDVAVPERRADRYDLQRGIIATSVRRLAALAEASG
jgi:uncharacterized protein YndB with AHSA1/START domain